VQKKEKKEWSMAKASKNSPPLRTISALPKSKVLQFVLVNVVPNFQSTL
jgi:hypothetical protein